MLQISTSVQSYSLVHFPFSKRLIHHSWSLHLLYITEHRRESRASSIIGWSITVAMDDGDGWDFGPEPVDSWVHAGEKSLEEIVDSAFQDRIESKKFSKQLRNVGSSPHTDYMNALWANRLQSFREITLHSK